MEVTMLNAAAAASEAEKEGSPFRQKLLECCGSNRWVAELYKKFPIQDVHELCRAADAVNDRLTKEDWLEAFAAHPKIGRVDKPMKEWEVQEQKATKNADKVMLDQLEDLNDAYFKKFGFIYIVCATGKSAPKMLRILESRMDNTLEDELAISAGEQSKITRIRLKKLLQVEETSVV